MRKIAIALTKGGIGKTTTAVNLAGGLALKGYKVLLVDTDTQGHAGYMLGCTAEAGLAEVISGEIDPVDAIVEAREHLWLLPCGRSLPGVKRVLGQDGNEQALADALRFLNDDFDFVILDTSPGWDVMIINALFFSHEILLPVSLEVLTLKSLAEFQRNLDAINQYRAVSVNYILPTFLDGRVRKSEEVLSLLKKHYAAQLCSPIRYNVRLSEAAGHGRTIYEYAPGSPGAADYAKLIERMVQHGDPKKNA